MIRRFKVLLCAIALMSAPPAVTAAPNCDAVQRLARIHDIYLTLVDGQGTQKTRAAARLYPMLADINPERFLVKLGLDTEISRFATTFVSAGNLARSVVTNPSAQPQALDHHNANIAYLSALVHRADCFPGGQGEPDSQQDAALGASFNPVSLQRNANRQDADTANTQLPIKTLLIAALFVALAAAMVYFLKTSRAVRIHMVNRLPRRETRLTLPIQFDDPETGSNTQTATTMDASLGGMKLRVDVPIPEKAEIVLTLPFGDRTASVVWSNTHYAGIMFQTNLSEDEFETLVPTTKNSP